MNKALLILFYLLMIFVFVYINVNSNKRLSRYKSINKDSYLDINVDKIKLNRVDLYINDSLLILAGLKLKSERPEWLILKKNTRGEVLENSIHDIPPPYRFVKQKNDDEILILRNNDTLVFSLKDLE